MLLDDAKARHVAERLGIARIGTLGILRRAKNAGLIFTLVPTLRVDMAPQTLCVSLLTIHRHPLPNTEDAHLIQLCSQS